MRKIDRGIITFALIGICLASILVGFLVFSIIDVFVVGDWIIGLASVIAVVVFFALLRFSDIVFGRVLNAAFANAKRRPSGDVEPMPKGAELKSFLAGIVIAFIVTRIVPAGQILDYMYG
ncbi:MAG: hypothetical protein AAF638_07050 [Pseudomonadota bacterium]